MPREKTPQLLKAATAARKLGVLLTATPREFQESGITRDQFNDLIRNPPRWLVELRSNGPHPRWVVAERLGVSTSGLARAGATEPMTTEEITDLLAAPPAWLITERRSFREVRAERDRIRNRPA